MKKKKNLLLCLCMAFAFCGTTATLVSCDDDKKPSVNKPVDYEEDGTYYVNVGDVEYTVTLDGGKFALAFGDVAISGDYKYDGETLTLKQGKKVIIPATLVNGVLKLTLNNQDYTLLVKVNYTVSFNVDGTVDEATKQTVLNGKKAAKPASPEKDGYTFVGWYADSSYTVPYTFNETVSNNLTLYARFVKNDATQQEFKITYEVDGEVLATVDTVGGAIYNLPTPAKEGKVFVGWWKSDFDSANKLTAQVKDGVEVKENTTLYAVWQSDAPVVSVTASGATWNAKGVGAQYTLVITAPGAQPQIIPVSTNSYEYDFTKQAAGEYSITVSVNGKSTTVYYNNKGLAKVSNFAVEGSVLTFNKVEGATKYLITVKCGDSTHNHVDQDLGDVNAFDFGNCVMPVEGIKFTVKAVANGYVSSVSDEYVVVKNLSAVENLAVSAETDEATWTAVENATEYSVAITYAGKTDTVKVSEAKISLKNYGAGEIKVAVVPVAFGYNSAAAVETTYTKARIAAPTALTINGETLEWATVEGATGYIVKVGENTYETTTNSFKFTSDNIPAGVASVEVSVAAKASAEANNSHFSDATKVNFGTMANTLTYKAGKVGWDAVLNVQKYEVQLNDAEPVEVANTKTSADITFTKAGVNTIKVRCYDANGTASDWVEIEVSVYEIHLLGNGGLDKGVLYKAKGDTVKLSETTRKGYTFSGWYDAAADGKAYENSFTFNGEATTMIYAGWTANKYKISLYFSSKDATPYDEVEVVYDQFYVLPVVADPSGAGLAFTGWFAEENAVGTRYADGNGNAENVYKVDRNINVYGCWGEFLEYREVLNLEGVYTYEVVAGRDIDKVTEITVPATFNGKKVTRVGGGAFERCANIKKINLPDTIEYIEFGDGGYSGQGNAFYYCSGLEGVYIYKTDGNHKRYYESGVSGSLIMTDSITTEKILVFVPKNVTNMTIDDGVEVIGANVFKSTEIVELTVPASVKRIESGAFYYCDSMTTLTFLEAKEGEKASLEIKNNGSFPTFGLCKSLENLTLPSHLNTDTDLTVFEIGSYRALQEIKVAATAEKGGFYAVDGLLCYGKGAEATIMFVPNGFAPKDGVFTVPETIYKIAPKAFNKTYEFSSFHTLNIGGHVTEIGESAFEGIVLLKNVNFTATTSGTTSINIGARAFYGCSSIASLKLPVNMGTLSANAFGGINGLSKVELDVTGKEMKLSANAFASASGAFYVSELIIGDNTPAFEVAAVFGNYLATLTVDSQKNANFDYADGVLFSEGKKSILYVSSSKAGEYTVPAEVEEIKANVFANRNISKITIPASVKVIGDSAFKNCEFLQEIVFEVAAQGKEELALTVGNNAFDGAKRLTKLTIGTTTAIALPDRTTAIGSYAFANTAIEGALVLPASLKSLGAGAYANTGITSVKIPAALTELPMGEIKGWVSTQHSSSNYNLNMSIFDMFDGCDSLTSIEVDAKNANYAAVNGVLYQIKKTETASTATLLYAPSALTVASDKAEEVNVLNIANKITVNGVDYALTEVSSYAFHNMQNIKKIVFADSTGAVVFKDRAFAYDSFENEGSIQEIQLPAGTEIISKQMFYNCTALEKVNVPYTVGLIDSAAYFNNYALAEIVFDKTPTGKTEVELQLGDAGKVKTGSSAGQLSETNYCESTFYGCQSLTTLTLPDRTTRIGSGVFYTGLQAAQSTDRVGDSWKFGITTVNIPANVTEIAPESFAAHSYDQGGITNIVLAKDSKLKTIGYKAFNRSGITEFIMPETVTTIGKYAFQNSSNLEKVVCSSQVEILDQSLFENCTSLSDFSFTAGESKIKTISTSVFKATALKSFTVPATVEVMKANVFTSCFDLETVTFATYEKDGKQVSNLAELTNQVFNYCPKLTSIVFPETVDELVFTTSSPTFVACQNLKTVTLPSTVTSIDGVFIECFALEEVIISPDNKNLSLNGAMITNKDGSAIRYCYAPVKGDAEGTYRIANTVTEIGYGAFAGIPNIKKLIIPNTVSTIGASAFAYMPDLEEVVFEAGNDGLTVFPTQAFYYCEKLSKVTMPDHLVSMAGTNNKSTSYAFYGCASLTEIKLPDSLKYVGGYMFTNSGVQKVTIPAGVEFTTTGTGTSVHAVSLFRSCPELEEIELLGKATHLPQYFAAYCPKLKTLKGFDEVKYLAGSVFRESGLESIDLSNVEFIYTYVFDGCTNLKSVKFGEKLTQMGGSATSITNSSYVFRNTALEEVKLPQSLPILTANNFYGCTKLKKVDLGGVKQVGNASFNGCSNLTQVVGIENATKLGNQVFTNCTALESIDLSSATSIGNSLFDGCTKLSSVKLNSTVTEIPYYTFRNCTALKEIELPNSLTSLGTGETFYGSGITSISVPSGVTYIDYWTFANCKDLETVEFLGKVTYIGAEAFMNCEKLSSVMVGSVLSTIESGAFAGCVALEEIELPNTLSSIGVSAFKGTGLRSVRLSANLSYLGAGAFLDCPNLTAENVSAASGGVFSKAENGMLYDLAGQIVWAPANLSNVEGMLNEGVLTVTKEMKFNASPFSGNTSITKIEVQEGVTEISAEMFRGIPNVTEIVLPEGITVIGDYAFADCAKLVKVNIPSTVKSIGNYAFAQTASAIVVDTTNATSLTTIGASAFENSGIVSLTLPAKVTALSNRMFYGAKSFSSLTTLSDITAIGSWTFAYTPLTEFDASKLEAVPSYAFGLSNIKELRFGACLQEFSDEAVGGISYISSLGGKEVAIPLMAKVETITFADNGKVTEFGTTQGSVFANLQNLKSVKLPNNLRNMNLYAFYNCPSLESISIPEGIETLGEYTAGSMYQTSGNGEVFSGCTSLKSVKLPSTLKFITVGAFAGCTNLETVEMNESLLVIGDEAFKGCVKLTNITLPKSIYVIGSNAFEGCTKISSLTVAKNTYVKSNAFAGWTAEQTVNFIGDKYSLCILDVQSLSGSNANFVFEYKETAGE